MKAGLQSSNSPTTASHDAPNSRRPTYFVPVLFLIWALVNLASSGVAELHSRHGRCCEISPPVEQKVLALIGGGAMDANAACNVLGVKDPSVFERTQALQISAALVGDALDAWVGVLNTYSLWAIFYAIVAITGGFSTWSVVQHVRSLKPLEKSGSSSPGVPEDVPVPVQSESDDGCVAPSPARFPNRSALIPAGLLAWTVILVLQGYLFAFAQSRGECYRISPLIEERVSRLIDQGAMAEEKSRKILGLPAEGEGGRELLPAFSEAALRSCEGAMFDMAASAWINAATSLVFGIGTAVWLSRLQRRIKSPPHPSPA